MLEILIQVEYIRWLSLFQHESMDQAQVLRVMDGVAERKSERRSPVQKRQTFPLELMIIFLFPLLLAFHRKDKPLHFLLRSQMLQILIQVIIPQVFECKLPYEPHKMILLHQVLEIISQAII